MKAVAAHAFRIEMFGDCIVICHRAVPAMKRGIEAGDLRQIRKTREKRPDGCEVVWLVKRSKRRVALQPSLGQK